MTTVGNIGVGLLILIILWILALLVFVIAVRTQSNLGWIALGTATVITIILISIPTAKHQQVPDDLTLEKDYGYIYRTLLFLFLIISLLVAFIAFLVLHCIEPVQPRLIKNFCVDKSI